MIHEVAPIGIASDSTGLTTLYRVLYHEADQNKSFHHFGADALAFSPFSNPSMTLSGL